MRRQAGGDGSGSEESARSDGGKEAGVMDGAGQVSVGDANDRRDYPGFTPDSSDEPLLRGL